MRYDKRRRFEEKSTERLREEGVYWEAEAALLKRTIAAALVRQIERQDINLSELARTVGTSRAALNRVLDPANTSLTLATLTRVAAALGCKVKVEIVLPR
jgi:antitoxin HicB